MNTLFPEERLLPEGYLYVPDFISETEEAELLALISTLQLQKFVFQGFEAKRNYASFGMDYNFDHNTIRQGQPIPDGFVPLIEKVRQYLHLEKEIAELLVLEYPVGAVINWHRDAPPFDIIVGISLLSDCLFKLRPQEKSKRTRKAIVTLPIKRRSLYLMQGAARSDWQHSTAPATAHRYSVTLRTLS